MPTLDDIIYVMYLTKAGDCNQRTGINILHVSLEHSPNGKQLAVNGKTAAFLPGQQT